ncbi:MAG TPA: phosphonate C-P lyase system protein PhnH, partial [Arenibaculum sp.]|nr:phosphonate C-P lyase system protein PhnH [Arenibaculum sp.]
MKPANTKTAETTAGIDLHGLAPGFADPVLDAQAVFRCVLDAMARPGRIVTIPVAVEAPAPLDAATAALCLALADFETPVWTDAAGSAGPWLRFHCGARIEGDPVLAGFAVVTDAANLLPLARFAPGSDAFPDRSCTLFVQVPALTGGPPAVLRGPGIEPGIERT